MKRKIGSILAALAFFCAWVSAEEYDVAPGTIAWATYKGTSTGYPYMLFLPADYGTNPHKEYDLVIHCHGLGGTACLGGITKKLNEDSAYRATYGKIVVEPISTGIDSWHNYDKFERVVRDVARRYNVNPNRIYVYGESMGGQGAFTIASRCSDIITASMPLSCASPGTAGSDVAKWVNVPIWACHAMDDSVTGYNNTVNVIRAISNAGGTLWKKSIDASGGHTHAYWDSKVFNASMWAWLESFGGPETGIAFHSASVSPVFASESTTTSITITVVADDTNGSVTNSYVNLSQIGGSSSIKMTKTVNTYTYTYLVPSGQAAGYKEIIVESRDNDGNSRYKYIPFSVGTVLPTGLVSSRVSLGTNQLTWNANAHGTIKVYCSMTGPIDNNNKGSAYVLATGLAKSTVTFKHILKNHPETDVGATARFWYAVASTSNSVEALLLPGHNTLNSYVTNKSANVVTTKPTDVSASFVRYGTNLISWTTSATGKYRIYCSTNGTISDANKSSALVLVSNLPNTTSSFQHLLENFPLTTVYSLKNFWYAVECTYPGKAAVPGAAYWELTFTSTAPQSWGKWAQICSDNSWATSLSVAGRTHLVLAVRAISGNANDISVGAISGTADPLISAYGTITSEWQEVSIPMSALNNPSSTVGIVLKRPLAANCVLGIDEVRFIGGTTVWIYGDANEHSGGVGFVAGTSGTATYRTTGGMGVPAVPAQVKPLIAGVNTVTSPTANFIQGYPSVKLNGKKDVVWISTNSTFSLNLTVTKNFGYWSTNSRSGPYVQIPPAGTNIAINRKLKVYYYGDDSVGQVSPTNTCSVQIIDNPCNPITKLTQQVGFKEGKGEIRFSWRNPINLNFDGILILRGNAPLAAAPFSGSNYSVGDSIGAGEVIAILPSSTTQYKDLIAELEPTWYYSFYTVSLLKAYSTGVSTSRKFNLPTSELSIRNNLIDKNRDKVEKKPQIWYKVEGENQSIVHVDIYSTRGVLVKSFPTKELPAGFYVESWDLKNEDGQDVSSGVYLVVVKIGSKVLRQKIMVVN